MMFPVATTHKYYLLISKNGAHRTAGGALRHLMPPF